MYFLIKDRKIFLQIKNFPVRSHLALLGLLTVEGGSTTQVG